MANQRLDIVAYLVHRATKKVGLYANQIQRDWCSTSVFRTNGSAMDLMQLGSLAATEYRVTAGLKLLVGLDCVQPMILIKRATIQKQE